MSSPFRLTSATFHGVALLRLSGDLTFDQTRVILELTDVATMDSTGIGALVDARQIFGSTGRVVLVRAPTRLKASLDVIHVTDLFELVDNESDLRTALTGDDEEKP